MPVAYIDVPFGVRIEAKPKLVNAIFEAIHETDQQGEKDA
jgi:hypothetical protein